MNFHDRAEKMGFHLTHLQLKQFETYARLLISWNERMDLTNLTTTEDIENRHFLDSLSVMRLFSTPLTGHWVDIGSGAGFPGIPLKILNPEMDILLLDSLQKRIHFLSSVIEELHLQGIRAVHGRAEDFFAMQGETSMQGECEKRFDAENPCENGTHRESFDFAISRAVAPLPTLLEYALPAVRVGGAFIAMKGPAANQELEEASTALDMLGGEVERIDEFEWTDEHLQRSNLFIRKIRKTPDKYPRKGAKARKKPIGLK